MDYKKAQANRFKKIKTEIVVIDIVIEIAIAVDNCYICAN